jgi:transposase
MSQKITATHARVDDIPAIIAPLKKMRVAAFLDQHFPTHGHWQGWSLGGTTVVWVAFMLSEGDHRLARVEPWGKEHLRPRRRCRDRQGRWRDLADDRWATILDSLCVAPRWVAFAWARTPSVVRVYDLRGRMVRVDPTTAAASVTPAGLCPLGHSKAHRPDLPQGKSALAVLAPLGVPWTITVVAGQTADDPLSLPESANVRQSAQVPGLTDVGDCTMAALGTRAASVAHQDDSWCPLSATQRPEAALARVRAPVVRGVLEPSEIGVPHADGARDATAAPVAIGLAYPVARSVLDHAGQTPTGQERRLVVRALALAARQAKRVRHRVARAVTALNALAARTQGQPRLPDEAGASQAAAALMAKQRVEGLRQGTVTPEVHQHVKRRDGPRPATTVRSERVRGSAAHAEAPRAHAVRRLGWRVDATNPPAEERRLTQGVAAYRSAYRVEQGFGRLQGRSVSLTPLCVQYEQRMVGLLDLLSIALRVLVLMPCVVRRTLQHAGTTRKGLSPGQPGRQTAQPTTERLLAALRGVTRSRSTIDGTLHAHLTPLHAGQKRILTLREVPREIYGQLVL